MTRREMRGARSLLVCTSVGSVVRTWAAVLGVAVVGLAAVPGVSRAASPAPAVAGAARAIDTTFLSQGARAWVKRAQGGGPLLFQRRLVAPVLGSNVDANDPVHDLAAGQSETAIAAQPRRGGDLVMAAWNDASGVLVGDSTDRLGSITGVALSHDGARHFTDLIGLPNNNVDQQWSGDPAVVSLGGTELAPSL